MATSELVHHAGKIDSADATRVNDLASGLFDGAIEHPFNGFAQMTGLPEMHLVDDSHQPGKAKQLGECAGAVLPFLLVRGLLRNAGSEIGIQSATGIMGTAIEAGATGAVMGLALTPVDNDKNFWESRFKSAGVNAATFSLLA